jgi:hypothetical protein
MPRLLDQLRRSIFRVEPRGTDRDRVLRITSTFFLHAHPIKIPRRALALTFTWGLGGISFLCLLLLVATGLPLLFEVRPEHALDDVARLAASAPGRLLRGGHRFASHGAVAAVSLHALRVFLTGSYKPPREFNWVLGVALLAITLLLAATGHHLLDPREGAPHRVHALHTVVLPLAAALLSAIHFFRVRKDGGISGPPSTDLVHTWPHLVRIEAITALLTLALVALAAASLPAPLTDEAWFLAGLRLMGGCFDPPARAALPALALLGLAALPYLDENPRGDGVYTWRLRPFAVPAGLALLVALLVAPLVAAHLGVTAPPATRPISTPLAVALALAWVLLPPRLVGAARRGADPVRFWLGAVAFQAATGVLLRVALRFALGI